MNEEKGLRKYSISGTEADKQGKDNKKQHQIYATPSSHFGVSWYVTLSSSLSQRKGRSWRDQRLPCGSKPFDIPNKEHLRKICIRKGKTIIVIPGR